MPAFGYELFSRRIGSTLELVLEENPSSGYRWDVLVNEGLPIAGDEYVPHSRDPLVIGGGGRRFITFSAMHTGRFRLVLVLRRPWDHHDVADRRECVVEVTP